MKKLGLVGGTGPESTVPYYHNIICGVQKKLGRPVCPLMTIESVDVFHILSLCSTQNDDALVDYLMTAINNLILCGADVVALTANTPHFVFDRLQSMSSVPMVSIVTACCDEAVRRGYHRVGLLGTEFTMKKDFYKESFRQVGIDIAVPSLTEMELINSRIASELEFGIVRDQTREDFLSIIARMQHNDGIEAIVLGCTELPLLLNDSISPVPCLDTMQIHIQKLVDIILD